MDTESIYSSVYYDQIAYVETLAQARGVSKEAFMAGATKEINMLSGKGRLPLRTEDHQLALQLKLPAQEPDDAHPISGAGAMGMITAFPDKNAPMTEMREHGVPITSAAALRVGSELLRIWASWHPEAAK